MIRSSPCASDLESEAAACQLDEDRSAPSARRSAGRNALPILRADHKAAFLKLGITARQVALERMLEGIPLSGADIISCHHRLCILKPLCQLRLISRRKSQPSSCQSLLRSTSTQTNASSIPSFRPSFFLFPDKGRK